MKQLLNFLVFIALASIVACGPPPVTFNEPQPVDTDNLSAFPKRLQGRYLSFEDSSVLIVSDKLIQRIYDFDYKIHPNQLDSNSQINGDTIIDSLTNEKTFIRRDGDSLVCHFYGADTLFQMNYDNVVRKLKGYYFLNTRYDKESWEVKKISLSNGQLIISGISHELDIENLKEIAEASRDTILPYNFTTTKKQFKKFVRNNGFTDSEIFIRLKKNAR